MHEKLLDLRRKIFDMQRILREVEDQVGIFSNELEVNMEREAQSSLFSSDDFSSGKKPENTLRLLIGELPTVLLSQKFFPDNQSLGEFSKRSLNLNISASRKRSRREIIGIIITEVAKLEPRKLESFRRALNIVLKKKPKGRTDFFDFWEKTIRSMSIG